MTRSSLSAKDEAVVDEILRAAERTGEPAQFRSRIGAHQYRQLYRLTRDYLRPGAEVLDWGAGNGHYSCFLVRSGYRVTGYSFEGFRFAELLDAPDYTFVRGGADPVALPFADARFDAVSSVGVLEHVHELGGDVHGSLRELRRVLRPGGIFLCAHLPNEHSLIERLASWVPSKHVHTRRYRVRDVGSMLRDAGFELLHVESYGMLPRSSAARLPRALARSRRLARAWDRLDDSLSKVAPRYAQNLGFVARSRSPHHDEP